MSIPIFYASPHRPASEAPFKWRFAGGPMMASDDGLVYQVGSGFSAPPLDLRNVHVINKFLYVQSMKRVQNDHRFHTLIVSRTYVLLFNTSP